LMYSVPVEGNILVVGLQDRHKLLDKYTKDQALVPNNIEPIAAGDTSQGMVVRWSSFGFNLETPSEFRPGILSSLKMKDTHAR